jgi:DNA-directed RNA polymerase specialized sigma24 family protein
VAKPDGGALRGKPDAPSEGLEPRGPESPAKVELIRKLARAKGFKPQDLPDIEQELVIQLLDLEKRYPDLPPDQEKALVTRTIHYRLLDIRKSVSFRFWSKAVSLGAIKESEAPEQCPSKSSQQIAEAISYLPDRDQMVCQELMKGSSGQEIAALLDVREETVCRIKRRLRPHFLRFVSEK